MTGVGYAVANDEDEHKRLTAMGYGPKYEKPPEPEADAGESDEAGQTVESVRAQLDALGITYKKTLGLTKLVALLPA